MQSGDKVVVSRSFNQNDVNAYIKLGGAKPADNETPEPLVGALFSYLLGMQLPGVGTKYLKQETTFKSPALINEELTASVEILSVRPEKYLVDLKTLCYGAKGNLICEGRALVYIKDVKND